MNQWSWVRVLSNAAVGLVLGGSCVVACGGDEATNNGVPDSPDAHDEDATNSEPDAGSAEGDAASDGDANLGCVPGRSTSTTVKATGASLSLCGATIEIPSSVLPVGNTVGVEIVKPEGTPWFEHDFSGPVFRFTPDDVFFSAPAKIALTRDKTKQRGPVLARWLPEEKEWGEHEGCLKGDTITLDTVRLGTFGLMQDTNVYPPGPGDLGQASLTLDLGGTKTSWTVPGDGGYSVYEGSPTDRFFILVARRYQGEALQNLDIRFAIRPGQPASLLGVDFISTDDVSGSWGYLEPLHGAPTSFTLTEPSAGVFQVELKVTAHKGDETKPLHAKFTTTPIKYRPPPSYSCGVPEGDPR